MASKNNKKIISLMSNNQAFEINRLLPEFGGLRIHEVHGICN